MAKSKGSIVVKRLYRVEATMHYEPEHFQGNFYLTMVLVTRVSEARVRGERIYFERENLKQKLPLNGPGIAKALRKARNTLDSLDLNTRLPIEVYGRPSAIAAYEEHKKGSKHDQKSRKALYVG